MTFGAGVGVGGTVVGAGGRVGVGGTGVGVAAGPQAVTTRRAATSNPNRDRYLPFIRILLLV